MDRVELACGDRCTNPQMCVMHGCARDNAERVQEVVCGIDGQRWPGDDCMPVGRTGHFPTARQHYEQLTDEMRRARRIRAVLSLPAFQCPCHSDTCFGDGSCCSDVKLVDFEQVRKLLEGP